MVNSEYKFRDSFKEFNSLDNLKKLDLNKDGKVDLKEIKKLDIDNDGVINDSEFDKVGINSKVVQDEITIKLPNLKESSIKPNHVVFRVKEIDKKINQLKPKNNNDVLYPSSITLESKTETNHRISEDIHNKYLNVKYLIKDSKVFAKFNNIFNKIDPKDENKLNTFLDESIKKLPFNLDKANLVLKFAKQNIPIIQDRSISEKFIGAIQLRTQRFVNGDLNVQINNNNNKIENRARLSSITGVGNCIEHASFSAVEEKKLGAKRVEIFGLDIESGHAFTVVNRNINSDDSNPKTCCNNCIIIDSWSDKTYSSSDFFKNIKEGLGIFSDYEYK